MDQLRRASAAAASSKKQQAEVSASAPIDTRASQQDLWRQRCLAAAPATQQAVSLPGAGCEIISFHKCNFQPSRRRLPRYSCAHTATANNDHVKGLLLQAPQLFPPRWRCPRDDVRAILTSKRKGLAGSRCSTVTRSERAPNTRCVMANHVAALTLTKPTSSPAGRPSLSLRRACC